jgi:hypothetical protein
VRLKISWTSFANEGSAFTVLALVGGGVVVPELDVGLLLSPHPTETNAQKRTSDAMSIEFFMCFSPQCPMIFTLLMTPGGHLVSDLVT